MKVSRELMISWGDRNKAFIGGMYFFGNSPAEVIRAARGTRTGAVVPDAAHSLKCIDGSTHPFIYRGIVGFRYIYPADSAGNAVRITSKKESGLRMRRDDPDSWRRGHVFDPSRIFGRGNFQMAEIGGMYLFSDDLNTLEHKVIEWTICSRSGSGRCNGRDLGPKVFKLIQVGDVGYPFRDSNDSIWKYAYHLPEDPEIVRNTGTDSFFDVSKLIWVGHLGPMVIGGLYWFADSVTVLRQKISGADCVSCHKGTLCKVNVYGEQNNSSSHCNMLQADNGEWYNYAYPADDK
jgi:hypothetical protein